MRAFVLSGGGNLGPTQVGALRALFERNIYPEMLVGCSAGALNAAYIGREFSIDQIEHLSNVWRTVSKTEIYPGNRLQVLWRLARGKDSLYDNRNFYAFLQRHGVYPTHTFSSIRHAKIYITATHLHSGRIHVFGDNPADRLLDAMMASTALTPMHPPYEVEGQLYIDGGTVTPLPLRVAVERGATEIYALHILDGILEGEINSHRLIKGVAQLMSHSVSTMLRLQAEHDLLLTEVKSKAKLHYIPLNVTNRPMPDDFSKSQSLIEFGYETTISYLEQFKKHGKTAEMATPTLRHRFAATVQRAWAQRTVQKQLAVSERRA